MTPRQFVALQARWRDRQLRADLRAGILAATMANFSMGKDPDKPPLQPRDFFPSLPEPEEEIEGMSFETMVAILQSSTGAHN